MPNPVPLTPPPVNARFGSASVGRYAGSAFATAKAVRLGVTIDYSSAPAVNTLRQRVRYL